MEEKKSRYTQAQNRATQKYQRDNLEQVRFWVRQGEKQKYVDAAASMGLSMAQFFINAADDYIERETVSDGKA